MKNNEIAAKLLINALFFNIREEIYGRLVQKFETDHNRPPTEEEVGPLREQAVKYAEQIIGAIFVI